MKTIALVPINADNILAAFALELEEYQKTYVSHPMRSLALAYVYPNQCMPFGLYSGEHMVGYVMLRFDPSENACILWHFMIDKSRQGQGIGKSALAAVLDLIRTKSLGDADQILLTCHPENAAALKLYHAAGFVQTGRMEGAEIELKLPL